jgi:hypothetical protein
MKTMTKSILKSVAIGLLFGVALFIMPRFIIGLSVILLLIRLVKGSRRGNRPFGRHRLAFAENVRAMNDEEYSAFKSDRGNSDCGHSTKKSIKQ